MLRIGLTGGIASGKSTVAKFFGELGVEVIDTDEISRSLVIPGSPALAAIVETFGKEVLTATGELDRRRLRGLVFGDPIARRKLEAILHPRIRQEALARADASNSAYVVIAVPLLFESGFDRLVDRCLVVDCPEAIQITRLMERDRVGEDEARAALAAQIGREARLARADDVIDNSGDPGDAAAAVRALHATYLRLAQNCPE